MLVSCGFFVFSSASFSCVGIVTLICTCYWCGTFCFRYGFIKLAIPKSVAEMLACCFQGCLHKHESVLSGVQLCGACISKEF